MNDTIELLRQEFSAVLKKKTAVCRAQFEDHQLVEAEEGYRWVSSLIDQLRSEGTENKLFVVANEIMEEERHFKMEHLAKPRKLNTIGSFPADSATDATLLERQRDDEWRRWLVSAGPRA